MKALAVAALAAGLLSGCIGMGGPSPESIAPVDADGKPIGPALDDNGHPVGWVGPAGSVISTVDANGNPVTWVVAGTPASAQPSFLDTPFGRIVAKLPEALGEVLMFHALTPSAVTTTTTVIVRPACIVGTNTVSCFHP